MIQACTAVSHAFTWSSVGVSRMTESTFEIKLSQHEITELI